MLFFFFVKHVFFSFCKKKYVFFQFLSKAVVTVLNSKFDVKNLSLAGVEL